MIKKGLRLFVLLSLLTPLLTGCWSRRELDMLAISSAFGLDKEGDRYQVSVQIVNPGAVASKKNGSGRAPVVTYRTDGRSVLEAIRRMTTEAPRKIYGAHLRVIVLGENLAKEGIAQALDLLFRDQEVRGDFYIVITKGVSVQTVLQTMTTLEPIPANDLFTSLEMSEKAWAATGSITLDDLVSDIVSKGKEPVLTGVQVRGNREKGISKENTEKARSDAILAYSGMAAFRKDKLVGWLSENESKGFNYSQGQVRSTLVTVPCPSGEKSPDNMGIQVVRTKRKLKARMENGRPVIDLAIKGDAIVSESGCKADLSKLETLAALEQETDKDITEKIEKALTRARKLKTDIFGFGEVIHRSYPAYWKGVKDQWDKEFPELPVRVKVDIAIKRTGESIQSIEQKMRAD
ncbi:Ger(x)C family spore germination protein [Paenibacillus aurantius]|uniref:Ger(X)C family spore germination protein n=1 Tax=Paenibacillus aurantius TaxID=2918900 RepID=A0AA96RE21_9BACL|nr:Ger(x)C family spore germination protein [Paenibacillus aurantius]WNQ10407.1 Ger(x)C family spore germination protein [Paenibacillus aurantius]